MFIPIVNSPLSHISKYFKALRTVIGSESERERGKKEIEITHFSLGIMTLSCGALILPQLHQVFHQSIFSFPNEAGSKVMTFLVQMKVHMISRSNSFLLPNHPGIIHLWTDWLLWTSSPCYLYTRKTTIIIIK